MATEIKDWGFWGFGDDYTPPEYREARLQGTVTGRFDLAEDGESGIQTSPIVAASGTLFCTRSGSLYELVGDCHPLFREWLQGKGIEYTPKAPLAGLILAGKIPDSVIVFHSRTEVVHHAESII